LANGARPVVFKEVKRESPGNAVLESPFEFVLSAGVRHDNR
jgi:hypothetical protein